MFFSTEFPSQPIGVIRPRIADKADVEAGILFGQIGTASA